MPDLLGFNPKRELSFDPNRGVGFQPGRPLGFDPRRPLGFEPRRDLGFGRRGTVFRGFVCPICGALTTETATECAECGTVFDGGPSRAAGSPPPAPKAPSGPPRAAPKGSTPAPKPRKPPAATGTRPAPVKSPATPTFCTHCGARLWEGDAFCWNCGARTAAVAAPRER